MRFTREQYIELMTHGDVERPMFTSLFGPLVGVDQQWRSQGAAEDEIDLSAFEWDYVNEINCGGQMDIWGGFTPELIEETDEYLIQKDTLGRTMKLCKGFATIPLPLDYPVTDMDSWLKVKPFYQFHEERIDWDAVQRAERAQQDGSLVAAWIPGGFDLPRQLMGEENTCLCYYLQPELMTDILETAGTMVEKVLERITEKLTIDHLRVHEDMAGKSGSLVGPDLIRKFIKPYYRRCWDLVKSRGAKIFSQDSDGDMNSVIDVFLECGLTAMYPMEPAAGMDIVHLRKKYGDRLAFLGGIDKHILRESTEDIRKELEYKMQPMMQTSGVAFALDHRITNGTPIDNYRYYVDLGREILGLPARSGRK